MEVYDKVNPSVVNIQVLVNMGEGMLELPFQNPDDSQPSPDQETPYSGGLGSGFVWDQSGHIVTNNHVVESAERINVVFSDGTNVEATLVGSDPDSDLAVLKVNVPAEQLSPVTLADSDTVKVGQLAVAIGNPFGLDGTMTVGIVSALDRTLPTGDGITPGYSIPNIIQTDAAINPGNSGGVLVDINGNLIGVTAAIESPVRANAGIGFVIPSNIVRKIVPTLISEGSYQHPWLGISAGSLVPQVAEAMSLPENTRGVLVGEVVENSPAAEAGLIGSNQDATIDGSDVKVGGDVIIAIEGNPVQEMDDLISYLSSNTTVGQTIKLTILRNGEEISLDVTLQPRPESSNLSDNQFQTPQQPDEGNPDSEQPGQNVPNASRPRLGIAGLDLSSELAQAMDLTTESGILIIEVTPGSPADNAGLQGGSVPMEFNGETILSGGDVITAIDGQRVTSVAELRNLLSDYVPNASITLTVLRGGEEIQVEVQLAQ
jgi:S1-C subfamily serine protease